MTERENVISDINTVGSNGVIIVTMPSVQFLAVCKSLMTFSL